MSGGGGGAAVGGLFSGVGAYMEGMDKGEAYDNEADQLEANARETRKQLDFQLMKQKVVANRQFGEMKAGYAASGITQDSGSVLEVMAASHINSEMDRLTITHNNEMRVQELNHRANEAHRSAGRSRELGYFNAVGSVFGGAMKAYGGKPPSSSNDSFTPIETTKSGSDFGSAGGDSRYNDTGHGTAYGVDYFGEHNEYV